MYLIQDYTSIIQRSFHKQCPKYFLFVNSQSIKTCPKQIELVFFSFPDAGGLANGNHFGNFARWNEPSREESNKKLDYGLHVSPTSSSYSASVYSLASQKMTSSGDPTSNARLHIQVPMGDQRCHIVSYVASTYIEVENLELIKISPFLSNENRR